MNKIIKVVGIDPSLSNFGIVFGELDIGNNTVVKIERMELTQTESGDTKKSVRVNSDDLRRASEIWKKAKPIIDQAQLIFCELPVGSQSSRAQTSYGICIGVLACIDKPLIQVTPIEIKKFVADKKTTTKEEIIAWATQKHPEAPWLTRKEKGKVKLVNKNEHLADAIAAIHTGIQTDQYRQVASVLSSLI
ncbi:MULTISPECIES: hypothetical protein [Xenorhabdus]|uniref:hypothetical protein n=1 Tax=Xenorhabdus TaxID=626 RepID=UPI000649BBD3|nr:MULTISPECIES: hypothetical protein [Xenorhabdus]KLU17104.1 hypothetical protein AAY47_01380 [Xenorhabdus griffiniae]KOP31701.1 hypothetical protein AFK69_19620 [Xenorhabdus sp. GDc328]